MNNALGYFIPTGIHYVVIVTHKSGRRLINIDKIYIREKIHKKSQQLQRKHLVRENHE